ncbi:MAG: EpsG family protein, partial [Nanoarchaeota archaeon]
LLFRLLLMPFTFFGLNLGAKIASVVFAAIAFTVFYWFLAQNKIKYPFFWSLLYLFTSEFLMYRFMLPRQMPLVITLLILTIYFLQKKRYLFLGITAFAFVLLHSSFVFQILIIILYLVLEKIFIKKIDYKLMLYPLVGLIIALLFNPYFPNNISFLYTQIFKVNLLSNLFNVEWKPWAFLEFIQNNILVLVYIFISLLIIFKNKKITKIQALFLSLMAFFFIYNSLSRRMQEFLVPFSILALAFLFNEHYDKISKNKLFKIIKIGAVLVLVIVAIFNFILLRNDIKNNDFLFNFDGCAEWMKNNIPKSSLIFTNAYAFPYLFFKNSDLIYTHGIDLTYSYLHDKNKFERYMAILQGKTRGKEDFIILDYNPDYVFSGKIKQDVQLFNYIVSHKENYKAAYEDEWCAVLEVR